MALTIVLDPGHGGKDPGAVGPTGLKESDVNHDVCRRVAEFLNKDEFNVFLTRGMTEFKSLKDRTDFAKGKNAYILVSVHCNAAENRQANGIETYFYKSGGRGDKLASLIQKHLLVRTGLRDRGIKSGNLHMVRESSMPAALVELGFISNLTEEKLLRRPDFQTSCALAIAEAISEYFGKDPHGVTIPKNSKVGAVDMKDTSVTYKGEKLYGYIIDGKTYVELRQFVKLMGKRVMYDPKTKTSEIKD